MSKTKTYAEHELDILVKTVKDPIIEPFIPEILAICEKWSTTGQSGGSAPFTAGAVSSAIKHLLLQQPICPITNHETEWNDVSYVSDGAMPNFQNNRCSALFKNGKYGKPYYLDAIVWQGEDEYDSFCGMVENIMSRQYVREFPFEPKTFRVNVKRELYDEAIHGKDARVVSCGTGDYVYFIKDREQLKEVFEYYDLYENNKS